MEGHREIKDKIIEEVIKEEIEKNIEEVKVEGTQGENFHIPEGDYGEVKIESNISRTVSESITKILIIIIMGMIFIIPLLDWNFWSEETLRNYNSLAYYLETTIMKNPPANLTSYDLNDILNRFINNQSDSTNPILNITFDLEIGLEPFYINSTINDKDYRLDDVGTIVSFNENVSINFLKIGMNRVLSIINISRTLFLCAVLGVSSFMFEEDANVLVLQPLDVMTEILNRVVNDPIGARNLDAMNLIQEFEGQKLLETEENIKKEESREGLNTLTNMAENEKMNKDREKEKKIEEIIEEHVEVKIIQKSIIKISALLAIGFGEAGSDIIKANLKSSTDLDPMMKGIKKTAFLGFCDIRGFSLVNEALKEDTVIFVNRIAEIVHKSADKFGGATNKNIGDAFLSVWKFPELNPNNEEYQIHPTSIYSQVVAEKAVLSYLYIIRAIKLSQDILDYSDDQRIKDISVKKVIK